MAGGLVAFGRRFRREAAVEMRESQDRVRDHAATLTPVKTGRMRSLLRAQPTNGGLGYFAGFLTEDFREEGQFPYFIPVILGVDATDTRPGRAGNDPLSPALEADRPLLRDGLRQAAFRAARS